MGCGGGVGGGNGPSNTGACQTFNVRDTVFGAKGDGVTDDTVAFQTWAAAINAQTSGVRSKIPAGSYVLTKQIGFSASDHLFDTDGTATNIYLNFDANAFDAGQGSVSATSGAAIFLYRFLTRTITNGDRIVVGGYHYVLDACADVQNGSMVGTVSRVGNVATFTNSQYGIIENGSNLSIGGAGYIVSLFDGTTTCTLLTPAGGPAAFSNGATPLLEYFSATITALNGGPTTFAAAPYTVPHVAAFRWRKANLSPAINGPDAIIARVQVKAFALWSADVINQKVAVDIWDGAECSVDTIRCAMEGTGALGGVGQSTLTPSIGVRSTGRELLHVRDCSLDTNQPIEYRQLIGAPDTSVDHFLTQGCLLLPRTAGNHGIRVRSGAGGSNFTVRKVATALGGGLVLHEGDTNTMLNVGIYESRFEQGQDPTQFAVDWLAPTQRLIIEDVGLGGVVNVESVGGIRVRNVNGLKVLHSSYTGGYTGGPAITHRMALDVDSSVEDINLDGYEATSGSQTTLATYHECVLAMPQINSNAPFPPTSYWGRTVSMVAGNGRAPIINGVMTEQLNVALAYGAQYQLAMGISGAAVAANVDLSFHSSEVDWNVVSIARVGTTATATIIGHGVPIGQAVLTTFAGATPTNYNGSQNCTAATANTLTFAVGGSVTTPATGTLTAVVPAFVAGYRGTWSPSGMTNTGKFGNVKDDGTSSTDYYVCFQYTVGGHNLQILNAEHWPPVTVLGTVTSTVTG